ncbi:insulinase family protein [Kitasatospora sp. NPDC093806]|uniref:insulinase family protein n=1 Tax=Kitasatospora sp. NPDC093806 TaxID=3155075 RepID=UPI00342DE744
MHHDLVDGVPVIWTETPGPLEATLMFGCGLKDETFRTLGVTHLVEHLAMSTLPRLHFDHNASVSLSITDFTCTGRPEQVVDFLARVCAALTALPLERIEQEAGVLAAEGSGVADPVTAELLSIRYGTQGLGLASFNGPGADRIPLDAVRETVARHFHAGNAVLALTGPPPEGLRLPLPPGPRTARAPHPAPRTTRSSWHRADVPGPGLLLSCSLDDQAMLLAAHVLSQRLTDTARHQLGLSYDVDGTAVFVGPGRGERSIQLDVREGQEQRVAELLWHEAVRLATEEPTEAELADEREAAREFLTDPRTADLEVAERAADLLFGETHLDGETKLALQAEVTPAQVREAFAAAMETALLLVPCGVERLTLGRPDGSALPAGGCSERTALPVGSQYRPPLLARARSGAARKVRLVVNADGAWWQDEEGLIHGFPFTEVVGVEVQEGGRMLQGLGNCFVPVASELFAGLGRAIATIDAAVPEALCYPASALRATG